MVPQSKVPRHYKERGKSAGQPMRSHTLTSRCLPLIYINTSVIRVFCPGRQDRQTAPGERGHAIMRCLAWQILLHVWFKICVFSQKLI